MKIAFISYEYPPDTSIGGIATYAHQIAKLLSQRGHYIEVFAGSRDRTSIEVEGSVTVNRVQEEYTQAFAERIGQVFTERHRVIDFDVLEGPEICACARGAVHRVPEIPFVVKLHTPTFLVARMNHLELSLFGKTRWIAGALRRGKKPQPFPSWDYNPQQDLERLHALDADEITTPSSELGKKLIEVWQLPADRVVQLPSPYVPSADLLAIPVETHTNVVTFLGRLEIRKGILELAQAIPLILKRCPNARFRFVGAAHPSPQPGLDMQQYLEKILRPYRRSLEFTGSVSLQQIPAVLAATDICVFPSRWENFPNVCLEAMAAARGVVGSNAGGMVEMLDGGRVGKLIPPHRFERIAEAVIELLNHPEERMKLGTAARDRILTEYNQERIGTLQEESYRRAIARRQLAGRRTASCH
jgi:glycogen synthase